MLTNAPQLAGRGSFHTYLFKVIFGGDKMWLLLLPALIGAAFVFDWGDDDDTGTSSNDAIDNEPLNTTTNGDDTIIGDNSDERISGQDGNDVIFAGQGDDSVFGGAGTDIIFGEPGDDRLFGNDGNDWSKVVTATTRFS